MDKHLNLFYSYNQGNLSSSERIKQLEDNLTRALIVTLQNLRNSLQTDFLKRLLTKNVIHSKLFEFDLQNTLKYTAKSAAERFLVVLQRDKSTFTIQDFQNFDTSFLETKTDSEKKEIEKDIRKHLSSESEDDFYIENLGFKFSELNSLLQFFYGNRPDAWVIGEKEVVLFETKIGHNSASKYQIYRHIAGKSGLNIKSKELKNASNNLSIINITWEEIGKIFQELKTSANERENFLINQFNDYISMTGQKLNLDYIVKGEVDSDIHREQFSLFLKQLDEKIKERNLPFERQNRNKSGLWEPYGIRVSENEISKDPHYTIAFRNDRIAIDLTTKNKRQINNKLLALMENYFEERRQNSTSLFRYNFRLLNYAILDKVTGQMQGERKEPFIFYVQFSEIGNNIKNICKIMSEFSRMQIYKQFELGYEIKFYDFSKIRNTNEESQIRYLNKKLLENSQVIIDEFVSFIEETQAMYNLMRN